jgi:hypothetical protein
MWRSSWHALLGYQRHLLQARFADRLLGLALDRMQEVGLYQRALVIVVADHGASYRFGAPFRPASLGSLPGVGPVPLMVKLPGADHPTGVVDRPVTTLDILPTIIDVLDIPATWPLEGHSLLDQSASSTSRKVSSDVMKTGELVPFPDHLGPLRDAVDHKSKVFGPNLEGLYKAGPAFSLIGQPLPAGKTSTLKGSLLWPSLLLDVKLTDRFVPCRLRGFVGYEGPPIPLAIALNGRIAGSTFSVPGVGESSFSLIVDPELLEPGRNEVSLAVMKTDGSFEPVELETQRVYQLQGNQICDDKGQPLPKEDGLDGMVMSMVLEEGGYKVEGWSVFGSGGSGVPPEELVIFQDGRFLLTAPPQPDGTFRLGLPKPVLVSDRRVRVFAVGGRGARELSYQDSYRQRAKLH